MPLDSGGNAVAESKPCSRCHVVKPLTEYSPRNSGRGKYRVHYWCKACRCADETARRRNPALIARARNKYENDIEYRAFRIWRGVLKRCSRENHLCDITLEWVAQRLARGTCEISGLAFDLRTVNRKPTLLSPSVDRIAAGGAYSMANCRMIVYGLNIAMREYGLDAFMPIARALVDKYPQPSQEVYECLR